MTLSTKDRIARIEEQLGITDSSTMRVSIIQDKSTSMVGRTDATISGYNEYIADLKADPPEGVEDITLTLTQFNTGASVVFRNRKLSKVSKLNRGSYKPGGMTALYDAIGRTISALEEEASADDKVLVLIMTDGQENSSKEYTKDSIRELIEDKQDEGNWTFVFIGADLDAMGEGGAIGIRRGNTFSFTGTAQGYADTYSGMTVATRSLASSGDSATADFANLMEPSVTDAKVVSKTTTTSKGDGKSN